MALFTQSRTLTATSTAIPEIMGQPALVPVKLSGTEGLNSLFDYQLDLKTPDGLNLIASRAANFSLNEFLGKELTVHIELEGNGAFVSGLSGGGGVNMGAGTREITGLITDAQLLGESGRFVHYQLTLRPWLHLAALNSDCRIYQDKTVIEILDDVLGRYSFPVEKRLIETYPQRDYQTQFNESDHHFFCRLCEEWGINWFFEHSDGKHRLVLTDNMGAHRKNPSAAYQQIPFYPEGHKLDSEYIHRFTPAEIITAGGYRTKDYDYTRPKADLTSQRSDPRPSAHNQQEVYEWHTDSHYSQPKAGVAKEGNDAKDEGDFLARMRMEALRQPGRQAKGNGHLRGMVPGCTFLLQRHSQDAANVDWLITGTTLLIEEVAQVSQSSSLPSSASVALAALAQRYTVDVAFNVHPTSEPYRPLRHTRKPFTRGPQTALVVGPADQNIWTDQYGRIKIQFPWDRLGATDQNSSCWVRVASPWAGNQLGGMQLPRIGQEVIVDFIGGDPDLPICTGRVHNQNNLPPWSLPGQSALSGFRSRELTENGGNAASGRSNHLILDDTEQQMQAQLKSDHLHSQLSLGHITRIEDNQGRKDPRGEGFELRTDGAGAIRAVEGLLLSANARLKAEGTIDDYTEIIADLEQALAIAKQLDPDGYLPHERPHETHPQQELTQAIADLHDHGKHHAQEKQAAGQPVIAISAPAGIASATPKDQVHYAGRNIDTIAGGNQQHYAMGDILHTAGKRIDNFSHDGDIRNIANKGAVIVQAQHNSMELTADASMTVTSTEDGTHVQAKEYILLQSGDSFIKITEDEIVMDARIMTMQSDAPSIVPAQGGAFELPFFTEASRRGKKRKMSI